MEKYTVSGMSCAACTARVEKAVNKVKGVTSCSVSLLTNSMGVEGTAASKDIIKAVEKSGYKAKRAGGEEDSSSSSENEGVSNGTETKELRNRLILSAGFLLILMYLSMGHMMWNWPLPAWFMKNGGNHVAMGLVEMILASVIMIINKKFFVSGFKALFHLAPNMDTLVAMGSGVSFLYSVTNLFAMTDAVLQKNSELVMHYMDNFYFESAAMIVTLITVGKLLESVSKGKTTSALKSLMNLAPKTAVLLKDGKEIKVKIEDVKEDDIFIVRPGESIPADGIIIEGETSVNESSLTGESIPADKSKDDEVSAATVNINGFIKCRAVRVGKDTTLSKIIKMVSDASSTKAPIAKIADKVSGVFVPCVISLAVLTFIIWLCAGAELSFSLSRAICVLVVSCPCALGLATPVAIMVGNGIGAKNGILFKTSASLEETGRIKTVVLDKTGTITKGEPVVTDIIPSGTDGKTLLIKAASLEAKSGHPLAKAVLKKAVEAQCNIIEETCNFISLPGKGLSASINGKNITGGSLNYIKSLVSTFPAEIEKRIEELSREGKTPLLFSEDNHLLGVIAVADEIKEDSSRAIKELKDMGLYVAMLTGDNERTAKAIGKKAGVDEIIASVLPDGKAKAVQEFKKHGKVCMAGDGINDAPALTVADTGMAVGAGTDVAIDAADVVLMKNSLLDVGKAVRLSRKTIRNIHENLFWAFFYNIILIPIAAGAYYKLFGIEMNPMLGAAAMSLSSFCVVTNALRLNFANIKGGSKNRIRINHKEAGKMAKELTEKTIKVEGMMCCNCENHVKKALEAVKGVEEAAASHETGEVKLKLSKDVPAEKLEKAVTEAGYKVIG